MSVCPDCGGTDPFPHNPGCLTLARAQREPLRQWRAEGGQPDPGRWAAREAEIDRLLASGPAKRDVRPVPKKGG